MQDGAAPFTVVGTTTVASGSNATVSWSGLTAGRQYEWYATVTDGNKTTTSSTYTFTTTNPVPTNTATQTSTNTPLPPTDISTTTPTPTDSPTPTITPTNTPTIPPTPTFTPTPTRTPRRTPTFTPTLTNIPTVTFTPTNTPALPPSTPTSTPTDILATPTDTQTNTPTFTPPAITPTFTPTGTQTPAFTPTPSDQTCKLEGACFVFEYLGYVTDSSTGQTTITFRVTNKCKQSVSYVAFGTDSFTRFAPISGSAYSGSLGTYNVTWTSVIGTPGFTSIQFQPKFKSFKSGASDVFSIVVTNFDPSVTIQVAGQAGSLTDERFSFLLSQTTCPIGPAATPTDTPIPVATNTPTPTATTKPTKTPRPH